jgi:hypothetical protein
MFKGGRKRVLQIQESGERGKKQMEAERIEKGKVSGRES